VGFSPYPKISATMRLIANDILDDYTDEYLCIGEDITLKCVLLFAKVLIRFFWCRVPPSPNEDTKRLMAHHEERGWPGMLGRKCPGTWHG
jgi:hypothetical protein